MESEEADMGKAYVIAVVGSGGKTTLIGQLAKQARMAGRKAAVMTTTHMALPDQYDAVGKTAEEAISIMEREGIVFYGSYAEQPGKMTFPGEAAYEAVCRKADLVLVEADGSRRLPMKVPDWRREPVIPLNTDAVIVVYGLSALGKPLNEVCQRWELAGERLPGWPGKGAAGESSCCWGKAEAGEKACLVTEQLAVDLLIKGYLKILRFRWPNVRLVTLLNQADSPGRRDAGVRMQAALEKEGWECRITQLRKLKIAVIYMASGFGKRFGGNKLLEAEAFGGKPLFRHGLDGYLHLKERLEREGGIRMTVVLVSQYPEILEYGNQIGICTVENPSAAEGITASIRLGTKAAAEQGADYCLYSVADQPWLREETLWKFLTTFIDRSLTEQKTIGCLASEGRRGNPVIFHRKYQEQLLSLTGDRGGSQIMKKYPEEVMEFLVDRKELEDIDRREDVKR